MPHALMRVLASTTIAGTVLAGLPSAAQAAQPRAEVRSVPAAQTLRPVPAVQEPPPATVTVPQRASLALQPAGNGPVGPREPEVTTPAGPRLIDQITSAATAVQEAQGFGTQAPDVRDVLPDTSNAEPLNLSKPLAAIARTFEGLGKVVPGLTYRLCVQSAAVPVACSIKQPVGVPVAADVTGDSRPDLAASLVPTADPGAGAAGISFAVRRLSRESVKAQVWAEYDDKVSVGFDGLRRGSSLSAADRGTFTVDLAGKRVKAVVERDEPGRSAAVVAGLTGRSAVSLSQTPATAELTVNAALDTPTLNVTASAPARTEAVAVTARRFTRAVLDRMPTRAEVRLSGGEVRFSGPSSVARAHVHDLSYRDGRLSRVTEVELRDLSPSFTARYGTAGGRQTLSVATGSGRAGAASLRYFDRAAAKTVLNAELSALPAKVRLVSDPAAHRVTHTSSSPIGRFAVVLQRNEGAVSTPRGGHVTMIKDGAALGVSGLLSGLSGFDATYGAAPHVHLAVKAGNRSFVGAASIDRTHVARMEISNTPATVDVTLDPAARKAVYQASGMIDTLRAAYANLRSGPTVDGTVLGVHDDVQASWELGERSTVKVATSSTLKEVRIYANKAHVTRETGEDLRVTVQGVRKRAELVADTAARTLRWISDGPVARVSALARARLGDRYARAAAEVTGVPAEFDASWNAASYRFRGLSGPVRTAALAFTNHDGAKAPTGPHLAAHYDQASGDLDVSVLVDRLSHVEFAPAAQGFTADFRSAPQTLAVDADVRQGDTRFGLLGTVGPVPGRLAVTSAGGRLTYSGSRLDVRARAWLGTAAALDRMRAAPAVPGGVSLVDGGCAAGSPGCAPGPFCVPQRGCFGLQGYLDVTGLPDQVSVDLTGRTFAFAGFRPRSRSLGVYLASSVLSPVPIKARATLTGLPSKITSMSVGPFGVEAGNAVRAAYRIEPPATLGALDVRAEAGGLRGHVAIDPVPAAVTVQGTYGARTRIRVHNSAAVKHLTAKVTLPGKGTGELRFSDVPAVFGVDADASAAGLGVPAVTYRAEGGAGTLDGHLGVEGGLVDPSGRLGDVSLDVRDLAPDTTIRLNPDQSLDLVSRPGPTGRIAVRAGLKVDPVAAQRLAVSKEIPYTGGFLTYHVGGQFGLGRSSIERLSLSVARMSWLRIRPGKVPFGMKAPPALGYVAPGFEGDYGTVKISAKGVDLRPDVRLDVRLSREIGADVFRESVRIGPATSLALRRYDQRMRRIGARQQIQAAGLSLACVTVDARPGFAGAATRGTLTLRGADGPQLVSLLDPGGQAPDYAVDLLTHFMSPFPGADWKVAGAEAGSCGSAPRPDDR
ncbi:hypothetical protein [Nonomuraea gerenzanensis]|uniref:Uncharacterized protein n=1 Tax=Nonomuraea gerenzanensis TaxID=93944 RepID=A0A1M4E972_9ACTN|nr:hypothetical protein [Nonomuraea gerenzanensis]UBU17550.1 hypothetical protein LCN96_21740 [Nonomuraea gerenzanensis]SBO95312.1 hypothetical protein BN4615_P4828 [Nonomuraea gerenzanensis]